MTAKFQTADAAQKLSAQDRSSQIVLPSRAQSPMLSPNQRPLPLYILPKQYLQPPFHPSKSQFSQSASVLFRYTCQLKAEPKYARRSSRVPQSKFCEPDQHAAKSEQQLRVLLHDMQSASFLQQIAFFS